MCFISKKVKQLAMSKSKVELYNEYEKIEDNCKCMLYAGLDKTLKQEQKKNLLFIKALKYQNTKNYEKQICKHTR